MWLWSYYLNAMSNNIVLSIVIIYSATQNYTLYFVGGDTTYYCSYQSD